MSARKVSITLECFVEKDGKYLMLQRGSHKRVMPNVWMAPGGHLEFCEGVVAAARREVREETNIEIKDIRIRAAGAVFIKDLNQEFSLHLVTAKYASGEVKADPSDGTLHWLTSEEILDLDDLLAELVEVLPHVFSDDPKIVSYRAVYESGNDMVEFEIENSN